MRMPDPLSFQRMAEHVNRLGIKVAARRCRRLRLSVRTAHVAYTETRRSVQIALIRPQRSPSPAARPGISTSLMISQWLLLRWNLSCPFTYSLRNSRFQNTLAFLGEKTVEARRGTVWKPIESPGRNIGDIRSASICQEGQVTSEHNRRDCLRETLQVLPFRRKQCRSLHDD